MRKGTAWYDKIRMDSKACSSLASATTQFRLAYRTKEPMEPEFVDLTILLRRLPSDVLKTYLGQE